MNKRFFLVFALIFFVFSLNVSAQSTVSSACVDYCSDNVYYSDGVFNERTSVCEYSEETCRLGCNERGTACVSSEPTAYDSASDSEEDADESGDVTDSGRTSDDADAVVIMKHQVTVNLKQL